MRTVARWSPIASVVLASLTTSQLARADERGACIEAAEKAQVERDQGKYLSAKEHLLACSQPVCPATVRADCTRWLGEVQASQPTIVISARDSEGRDLGSVRVLVDGAPFAERLDGKPMAIDPGAHVFRYELGGRAPIEEQIIISAGERDRVLRVPLPRSDAHAMGAVPSVQPPPDAPVVQPETSGSSKRTAGFIVGGVGLAAIGVGAVFGVIALGKNSDAKALCPSSSSCTSREAERTSRDATVSANVANITIGAGVLALGIGTYLVLTAPQRVNVTSQPVAVALKPHVGPSGGGASLEATW